MPDEYILSSERRWHFFPTRQNLLLYSATETKVRSHWCHTTLVWQTTTGVWHQTASGAFRSAWKLTPWHYIHCHGNGDWHLLVLCYWLQWQQTAHEMSQQFCVTAFWGSRYNGQTAVSQMLSWWTKNSLYSNKIHDTVTNGVPLCSVHQAPSYEPNLTLLA